MIFQSNKKILLRVTYSKKMYSFKSYISDLTVTDYITKYRDADKFIVFCKQCNKYDRCWACPPYSFNTGEYLLKYKHAYIIGTKIILSESLRSNSTSPDKCKQTGQQIIASVRQVLDKQLLQIENEISDSKAFFAGTCHLCPTEDCTRTTESPCRYPDRIRPSLEAFGFDIGKTCENLLKIELKWSNDGLLPEYLTLVSGLFSVSKINNIGNHFSEL